MDFKSLQPGTMTVYHTGTSTIGAERERSEAFHLYRLGKAELFQKQTGRYILGCNVYDYMIYIRNAPPSKKSMHSRDAYFEGLTKAKSN